VPIVTAIVAPLSGRISDAIGYRFLTTFGLVVLFAGLLFAATLYSHAGPWDVVLRLVIIGIGAGVFQAPNSTAMMSAVPKKVIGVASGLLAVTRNIGISAGVAVSTAVFMYRQEVYLKSMDDTAAFVHAFSWVITTFAFLVLLAAIISVLRRNRAPDHVAGDRQG
jgi:MFS family permease